MIDLKAKWGNPVTDVKVQIDRWPLTADEKTAYVLTVVCMRMYAGKPSEAAIRQTLREAIEQVR